MVIEVIASQIREHRHIEGNSINPLLRQRVGGNFHDRFRSAISKGLIQQAIEIQRLRRGVRRGQDVAGYVILDRSYQCVLPLSREQDRFDQKRSRALAVRASNSSNRQPFCGPLIEIGTQAGESAASMRNLRPGYACARLLSGRIAHHCDGAIGDGLVDELITIAGLAKHRNEQVARFYAARIVFQATYVGGATLRQDFCAIQELLERHWIEL